MTNPLIARSSVTTFAPICRIDVERREVWGPLSTERIGTDGRVLDFDATVAALTRWAGPAQQNGNLREMHDPKKAVGVSIRWEADPEHRCVFLGSKVSRGAQDTWEKIVDGVLRYYSLKGPVWAEEDRLITANGVTRRVKWTTDYDIEETSYVDRPGDTGIAPLQILRSAQGWNTNLLDSGEIDFPAGLSLPEGEIVRTSTVARAETKSESDGGHSASDYAYVPDPDKPSTWKLRIDDAAHVGAAAAALGPGYRGQKVDIPAADRAKVVAKVRAAWKRLNPDKKEDEMPAGIQRADVPEAADVEVSDGGTHGAASGSHTHDHQDGDKGTHSHEHSHDGNGDHGHGHSVERRQSQRFSTTIFADITRFITDREVERQARIQRQEGETPPAEEASQADKAKQIIGLIAELLAAEVSELADDPDEDNYGAQCLMCAISDLQAFCGDEAQEMVARRREGENLMATSDEINETLKGLRSVMERFATPVVSSTVPVVANIPEVEVPVVERSQSAETPAEENAILKALQEVRGFIEQTNQRFAVIERTTPALPGPILRTQSVPVEKLWPGGAIPTEPEAIQNTFASIAEQTTDPSVRERAQLEAVRRSILEAQQGAVARVVQGRTEAFSQ